MKNTELTYFQFKNLKLVSAPVENTYPDATFFANRMDSVTKNFNNKNEILENVSTVMLYGAVNLQASELVPAFIELSEIVKDQDKDSKINWENTLAIVQEKIHNNRVLEFGVLAELIEKLRAVLGIVKPEIVAE